MIWLRKDRKIPVVVLRCKAAVMGYGIGGIAVE
jgi:hypothetical protein